MKKVTWLVCLSFVMALFAAPLQAAKQPKVDWGEEYIKARGLGSFKGAPTSRRLIIAREKAKMRAERDLLGIIYKLNIDSETTMKETMESDEYTEIIKKQIKGTLKGAKVLAEGQLNRNTYEVIMGVKFSEVRKAAMCNKDPEEDEDEDENPIIIPSRNFMNLGSPGVTNLDYMQDPKYTSQVTAPTTVSEPVDEPGHGKVTTMITDSAPKTVDPVTPAATPAGKLSDEDLDAALVGALPGQTIDKEMIPAPAPTKAWTPPAGHSDIDEGGTGYTSLIVDARRLNADRAFWPRVLGPGQEVIYGNYDASVDFLQDEGAVAYCESIDDAKSCNRAKGNPLIVKAVDVYGKYKADLVLSAEDAEKVKAAEVGDGFLKAYRVMFILK
mgnify:CR=1 FL=1